MADPASPQGAVRCPLASGTHGGNVAADRSATRHPERIELDSFCVSGSPGSCCSMEVVERRDPIKRPFTFRSFQQQMPQCGPLSSPVSPNVLLQSLKTTSQFVWSSFLLSPPGSRTAAAQEPGITSARDGPGITQSPAAFWRHLPVRSVPCAGPGACGLQGLLPSLPSS